MGRRKKAGDEEILRAMALSPDPIATTAELAEIIDYSPDGIRNRLEDLEEKGLIESKDVGARATVWWITRAGRNQLS